MQPTLLPSHTCKRWGLGLPHYRIEIIPAADDRLGGASVMEQEERRFANLGQALQRAREMYERHKIRAKGFRIFNAAGELLHVWMP